VDSRKDAPFEVQESLANAR